MSSFTFPVATRGRSLSLSGRGVAYRSTAGNNNQTEKIREDSRRLMPRPKLIKPKFWVDTTAANNLQGLSKLSGESSIRYRHSDQLEFLAALEDKTRQLHSLQFQLAISRAEKIKREIEFEKASFAVSQSHLKTERKPAPILTEKTKKQESLQIIGCQSSGEKDESHLTETTEHLVSQIKANTNECSAEAQLINPGPNLFAHSFVGWNTDSQNFMESTPHHSILIQMSETLLAALRASREEIAFLRRIIAKQDSQMMLLMRGGT